jgi:chaperone modulatory protein CbpM
VTRIDYTEVHWIDEQPACSLRQLAEASRLSEQELRELVELGALQPSSSPPAGATAVGASDLWFGAHCLVTLRAVRRLRDDFDLDTHALSVALALLERIEGLERELRGLRARQPGAPP